MMGLYDRRVVIRHRYAGMRESRLLPEPCALEPRGQDAISCGTVGSDFRSVALPDSGHFSPDHMALNQA